jgi:hypothetical protein
MRYDVRNHPTLGASSPSTETADLYANPAGVVSGIRAKAPRLLMGRR